MGLWVYKFIWNRFIRHSILESRPYSTFLDTKGTEISQRTLRFLARLDEKIPQRLCTCGAKDTNSNEQEQRARGKRVEKFRGLAVYTFMGL
jgi:hypothetical protein